MSCCSRCWFPSSSSKGSGELILSQRVEGGTSTSVRIFLSVALVLQLFLALTLSYSEPNGATMSFEATLPTPPADPSVPFPYPIARPDPSSRPVPPAQVTPEQETHLQKLIDHFNDPSFTPPNQLKVLKAAHTQAQGGGSRFGRLFGGATAPTEQEVCPSSPLSLKQRSTDVFASFLPSS